MLPLCLADELAQNFAHEATVSGLPPAEVIRRALGGYPEWRERARAFIGEYVSEGRGGTPTPASVTRRLRSLRRHRGPATGRWRGRRLPGRTGRGVGGGDVQNLPHSIGVQVPNPLLGRTPWKSGALFEQAIQLPLEHLLVHWLSLEGHASGDVPGDSGQSDTQLLFGWQLSPTPYTALPILLHHLGLLSRIEAIVPPSAGH